MNLLPGSCTTMKRLLRRPASGGIRPECYSANKISHSKLIIPSLEAKETINKGMTNGVGYR
jgi:hypothetical protein